MNRIGRSGNGAERNAMERSEIKIPFHCLKILGHNKTSCSFRPNRRGRNMVVSGKMEWNKMEPIPLNFAPLHPILNNPNNRISFHYVSFCSFTSDSINSNQSMATHPSEKPKLPLEFGNASSNAPHSHITHSLPQPQYHWFQDVLLLFGL